MLDPQQIEDIYPLTPMQRGMLFHSLYAPRSAVYFQQEGFRLQGRLERAAFVRAWELVLARHSILRTAIVWEGLDEPVQVVFRQVPLPLEQHDWRAMPAAAQPAALAAFAQADRERGFDTVVAPLMRLALIQLADDTYHFIWSRHHLLLDGWSVALLLKEALHCYAALCQGRAPGLDRPQPFREYLAWLQRQDTTQAEQFWRAGLAGLHAPTPLGVDHPSVRPAGQEQYGEQWAQITPATTAALQALARAQRVTLNTLFQGAWALMLSRYSGQEDVLFGATNSGRPTTIAGIEHMAGLFINTLPVRVRVAPNQPLAAWLQRLLAQGFVQLALAVGQLDPIGQLGARRQFGQHLCLGPAQNKRLHQAFQRLAGGMVALGNRRGKAFGKARLAAKQAGVDKAEQAPQLAQMVFHRGAAGGQAKIAVQGKRRLGTTGVGVSTWLAAWLSAQAVSRLRLVPRRVQRSRDG